MLVDDYYAYCVGKLQPAQLWGLLEPLDAADLIDLWPELWALRLRYQQISSELIMYSSGTTGAGRYYPVGPYGYQWLELLESANKYPGEKLSTILVMNKLTGKHHCKLQAEALNNRACAASLVVGWFYDGQSIELLDQLDYRFALRCDPEVLLYLATCSQFIELVNRLQVPLITTNHEGFYKRSCFRTHVNDCMIDWRTGLNFYQCVHNYSHCLPMFMLQQQRIMPLLNLCGGPQVPSDYFEITGTTKCVCGRSRILYRFVPHQTLALLDSKEHYIYAIELAELLRESYQNLQFIQTGPDTLDVLYVSQSSKVESDAWYGYFKQRGFHTINLLENHYLSVMDKRYVFFANKNKIKYRTIGSHGL